MMKKILVLISILWSTVSYAAVGGESLINVQDTTAPTGVVQANRVKDAATLSADAITSGIIANGGLLFNGTNWDRMPGDKTNGAYVNIKSSISLTFVGSHTPSDAYANPTDAVNGFSLLGGWNGSTWDRLAAGANNADAISVATLGILKVDSYGLGFNGTTWDRLASAGNNSDAITTVTLGVRKVGSYNLLFNGSTWDRHQSGVNTGQALVDNSSNAANHITTNATTAVKATGGVLNALIINVAGTTSTAAFYNIASAGCAGTPASGYQFTLGTAALAIDSQLNHTFPLGICVVTAGAGAADISVLYR